MSGYIFGTLQAEFNPFDENYLVEILAAAAVAWNRMKHPTTSELEDQITYRLAGRIANDPVFAEIPYDVIPQCWILGLNGERLGRLDIRFKHRHSQRDYFAFEAKRLHVTYPKGKFSTEYPTYTGDEGMMAFVDGHYSKGFLAGGMLGYVMDGKSDRAFSGLKGRIEARRNPLKLATGSELVTSGLSNAIAKGIAGTHLGETEHDLSTHHLRLFHLVLPIDRKHKSARI
jgi:hypothetical protein